MGVPQAKNGWLSRPLFLVLSVKIILSTGDPFFQENNQLCQAGKSLPYSGIRVFQDETPGGLALRVLARFGPEPQQKRLVAYPGFDGWFWLWHNGYPYNNLITTFIIQ
jgi:hypothetical protein